jgi:hypothetical protein
MKNRVVQSLKNSSDTNKYLDTDDPLYWQLKESLISSHHVLLRILKFDTSVPLAHPFVATILSDYWEKRGGGNYLERRESILSAWNMVNEVYRYQQLCLNVDEKVLIFFGLLLPSS